VICAGAIVKSADTITVLAIAIVIRAGERAICAGAVVIRAAANSDQEIRPRDHGIHIQNLADVIVDFVDVISVK
jgi:hypothetical protein